MELKEKNLFQRTPVLILVAMLCCALWGSATPAIKLGYASLKVEGVPSIMLFAGIRFILAGIFTILIFSAARKKFLLPKRESVVRIGFVSLFQTILQYVFFYLGLYYTTGVKGTVASGSGAFFAVLIASLIFRQEKLTFKKIFACIIGFLGILVINLDGLTFTNDLLDLMGVGFVLLSTISSSFSSVLIKKYSKDEDPVIISGYQFFIGGIVMALIGVIFGGEISLSDIYGIVDLVYLGLLSAIAYSLWGILLKQNPVSRVTVFNFMTPVFGVFLTALATAIGLINESSKVAPLNLAITLVLVCLGIFLLNYNPQKAADKTDR